MAKYDELRDKIFEWAIASEISPRDWGLFYDRKLYNGDGTVFCENANPLKWCKYFSHQFIMGIWFEGWHANWGMLDEILAEYNLYMEHCTDTYIEFVWNGEGKEPEYTVFEKPEEPERLYWPHDAQGNPEIAAIMGHWFERSRDRGDKGSCVIGAGFTFRYKGKLYFMTAQSPWQGSLSWEPDVDIVRKDLEAIGATEITYDWGRMD